MTNPGCAPSKTWGALELPAQQELRDLPGRLDLRVLLGHPDPQEDHPDLSALLVGPVHRETLVNRGSPELTDCLAHRGRLDPLEGHSFYAY